MLTQALIIALAASVDAAYLRASESRRLAGHGVPRRLRRRRREGERWFAAARPLLGRRSGNRPGVGGRGRRRGDGRGPLALDEARRGPSRRELGLARTPLWEIHGSRLFAGFFVVHEAGEGGVHLWRCHRSRGGRVDPHFCAEVNRPQHVVEASFGPVEAAGFPFDRFGESSRRAGFVCRLSTSYGRPCSQT